MRGTKIVNFVVLALATFGLACAALLAGQTRTRLATQLVANTNPAALQLSANEAMARGDYAKALPLLIEVSKAMADQPDNLGSVLEQIRVCKRQLANPLRPPMPATISLNNNRKPHPVPVKGDTLTTTLEELGNFDYDWEKGSRIPDDVTALEGVRIRTFGYMIPLDQAERINRFALVPSLKQRQVPPIQQTILCQMAANKSLEYIPDLVTVEDILHVHEERDHGSIVSIFQADVSGVTPGKK